MNEEELEPLYRVAIIAVAALILVLTIIITACFVIPGCCGYYCLQKMQKKNPNSDKIAMLDMPKRKISIRINDKMSPFYRSVGPQLQVMETQENSTGPRSLFNGSYRLMNFLPSDVPQPPPTIKIRVSYSADQDVTSMGRLLVDIFDAENIPPRVYPTLPDSSVRLQIVHRRWTLSRQENVIHEVQTRVVRSSSSPTFEQKFVFAASTADIKAWCLRLSVFDDDRQTRCRETCCGKVNLRDLPKLSEGEPSSISLPLEPITSDLGQLLVALSYLPVSQRLNVSVMKAFKLVWHNVVPSLLDLRPCVRVVLLDHSGRVLKKKKIGGQIGVESPEFSGNVTFQISPLVYETATLLLVVYSEKENEKQGEDGEKKKKDTIGFSALGWLVQEESSRDHWRAVLQTPRKVISQWHTLK